MGRVREEKKKEDQKGKFQKKEDPGARKGRTVAKHCVFPMICGSGGSKSRLAKAAGGEPAGQMRDEKLHAAVAKSTFTSQNTTCSEHFLKLRCRKSAQGCGAKHISKSKCIKHTTIGRSDDGKVHGVVAGSTFPSQNVKTPHARTTFGRSDDEKVHGVVARSTFGSQNVQNAPCSDHFWKL